MGPQNESYFLSEGMSQLMIEVSPESLEYFEARDRWVRGGAYFLGIALGSLVGGILVNNEPIADILIYSSIGASLTSLTLSFLSPRPIQKASRVYNQKLRQALDISESEIKDE